MLAILGQIWRMIDHHQQVSATHLIHLLCCYKVLITILFLHLNYFLSHFLSSFLQDRSRSAKVVDLNISMITMGILSPQYDIVIGYFERQQYCDRVTGLSHLSRESCVHYHAYPPCIHAKHPTFQCNELYISAEVLANLSGPRKCFLNITFGLCLS